MTSRPLPTDGSPADDAGDARDARRRAVAAEVRHGLWRVPRQVSSKYFYDERGSRLFEEITALPEYYLTGAEREILDEHAAEIAATWSRTLVELGAGSAAKTRVLLNAMRARASAAVSYVPVDVSADFLDETRRALEAEMPRLRVIPVVADLTAAFDLPPRLASPVLFAFLGSTIGNFEPAAAAALFRRIRAAMRPGDALLLGTDLRKDRRTLEAAYNDSAGVTAAFNRNALRVLNAELGADFVPEQFDHQAFYNEAAHRIEMHLTSRRAQTVHMPGMPPLALDAGESIRTEVSYKFDRRAVEELGAAAHLDVTRWFTDRRDRFALSVLEPRV